MQLIGARTVHDLVPEMVRSKIIYPQFPLLIVFLDRAGRLGTYYGKALRLQVPCLLKIIATTNALYESTLL